MRNPDGDPSAPGTRFTARAERVDRLTREWTLDQQFWQLWRAGQRPDPQTFLAGRAGLSPAAVAAVLTIDQYERWLTGERTPAERYVALVPDGAEREQAVCDLVYGEYLLREQLGEHPDATEYRQRFPAEAALFDRQLELHRALALEPVPPPPHSRAVRTPTPIPLATPARETIPGYDLLDEIGRGGMGVVYKARQLNLDRLVALKVLPLGPSGDGDRGSPTAVDRMRREAQVMARLSHPNIVTVFDAGSTATSFYLAMEYVPGKDLHRLVEEVGPLPVETACDYMRQAALGLQHAHAAGLVHRDVKPSNLIVAGDDPTRSGTLKILDLGLARLVAGPGSGQATITHVGTFMGTPDFIAPEQANDPRTADHRSDLYSLGCSFFYVLTGRPPFSGATPLAKLMHHHLTAAPDPREARPELPDWVAELVRRLLAKRPEDRFQTAAEVAAALTHAAATPVATIAPPAAYRPGLLHRLPGHADWVKGLAFSPDGGVLASVSLDRTVRLWDYRGGGEVWRSPEQGGGLLCLAFSPADGTLAVAGEEGLIGVWEPANRRPRWQVHTHGSNLNCLGFDGTGRRLLSGGHDGALRLWDAVTGGPLRQWTGHTGAVWGVALTHDGRLAVTGGQDRALRLWEAATGESLVVLPEQPMLVTCLALSPSGGRLVTGGVDGVIHVWDLAGPRQVGALEGHAARVTAVAFSPDGREVASASRDQSVRIWRLDTGREAHRFDEQTRWVSAVAWSPDGRFVASGGTDRSICVYAVRP